MPQHMAFNNEIIKLLYNYFKKTFNFNKPKLIFTGICYIIP